MSTKTTTTTSQVLKSPSSKKQRVTLFLNPALTKHARAEAVIEDLTFTSLVEKALIAYLPKETVIKKPKIN